MDHIKKKWETKNWTLLQRYEKINNGEIQLPIFQRDEAWEKSKITSLLRTIIGELPLGITLGLKASSEKQFDSKYISGAPKTENGFEYYLLDGQQRLTAFWKLMQKDGFSKKSDGIKLYGLFIKNLCENKDRKKWADKNELKDIDVVSDRSNRQRTNDPSKQIERGVIPSWLLSPGLNQKEIEERISKTGLSEAKNNQIKEIINKYRTIIENYILPIFVLPDSTTADIALDVFINMNTNSKPLSTYDILVAQVEKITEHKLSEYENKLKKTGIEQYTNIRDYILDVSCYLQNKKSSRDTQLKLDKNEIINNRDKLTHGTEQVIKLLKDNKIYDHQRLPTTVPLGVISAIYGGLSDNKTKSDQDGNINKVLRKYLWRSFFTNRYENSSSSKAWADFEAIKKSLTYNYQEIIIPIFEENLSTQKEIVNAGWPKGRGILAKAILLISLQFGARDLISDGNDISPEEIKNRHYHHIYPQSLLKKNDIKNTDLALNCMLLRGKDNIEISDKHPSIYLREINDQTNIVDKLHSHFIPASIYNTSIGSSDQQNTKEYQAQQITEDYNCLINSRAQYIIQAMNKLCDGEKLQNNIIKETEDKLMTNLQQILLEKNKREESGTIEFKSSLRRDIKNNKQNDNLEQSVIKTIQAFMNSKGGILIIGMEDDGTIFGLENDYSTFSKKPNRDGFSQHLVNLFINYIGQEYGSRIDLSIEKFDTKDIAIVKVEKASGAVYLKKGKEINNCNFYVRILNTTQKGETKSDDQGINDINKKETYIKETWG